MSDTNIPLTKGRLIEQVRLHDHHDPHRHGSRLTDVILGGQDGLVNTLGAILGMAAATQDAHIVIAAGLAATFAESISMDAVAYTSTWPPMWRSRRSAIFIAIKVLKAKHWKRSWMSLRPTLIYGSM